MLLDSILSSLFGLASEKRTIHTPLPQNHIRNKFSYGYFRKC